MLKPTDFQHPIVEALPVLGTQAGYLIGFRMWDLESMETEFTVAFLTEDFKSAKQVFAAPTEVMDWWSAETSVFMLRRDSLEHVDLAFHPLAPKIDLPFAAYALDGNGSTDLMIVGVGIARFNGTTLERYDLGLDATFRSVAVNEEVVHVVGEAGVALSIEDAEIHQWPLQTDSLLNDVVADSTGFAIAGKSASFRGDGQRLEQIRVPTDVENMVAVTTFRGVRYWGADGWGDGYGFFQESPDGFKRLSDELPQQLTADDDHLFLSCAAEVYRYDGEAYDGLGLRFVDGDWVLRSIL